MLREGLIDNLTEPNADFSSRYDVFFSFVTEERPGHDRGSYITANAIQDRQERDDRYYFLAMANPENGGVKVSTLWSHMETFTCCSGAAIYAWCRTSLEMSTEVCQAFLQRLLNQKLIAEITSQFTLETGSVIDSESAFYHFMTRRPRRIKKSALLNSSTILSPRIVHPSTEVVELTSEPAATATRTRAISVSAGKRKKKMKLNFTSNSVQQTLSEDEIKLITNMMKPDTGVEIEAVSNLKNITASIFKGRSVIKWLKRNYTPDAEEALAIAESLGSRKVIQGYCHKGPIQDSDLLFHFGRRYLAYCKREHGVVITPRDLSRVRKPETGPILFERNPGKSNPQTSDSRTWTTYWLLILLAAMAIQSMA